MGALLSYSLAASVIVLLLFPILHLIVNRSTSFCFNRAVIICGMAMALAFPFVFNEGLVLFPSGQSAGNIYLPVTVGTQATYSLITDNNIDGVPDAAFPWVAAALIVYLTGIAILLCREIISFIHLFRMIARCERMWKNGITFCRIEDNRIAPFSWGSFIFLNDSEFMALDGSVYLHEMAHTERRHWIDILFADLFCILLWYNPFAWMIRQLMKLNHEFEADSVVIRSGIGTCDYQRLLVTKAMGMRAISVTNSFAADKRNFRKRVLIMNRKRSSPKIRLIALCAIPAFAVAGLVIASPVSSRLLESISDYSFTTAADSSYSYDSYISYKSYHNSDLLLATPVNATSISIIDPDDTAKANVDTPKKLPSPLKDQTALAEVIRLSLATIQTDKETKVNIGIVVDEDGRVKEVVTDNDDNPLVKTVVDQALNGIRFEKMTQDGKPIKKRFHIPVTISKQD